MEAEGASLDPLFYVVFYGIAPFIIGGVFIVTTDALARVGPDWYTAVTDKTDSNGKTPWYMYPLKLFVWPSVWLLRLSGILSELFEKQKWPMKLLLVYAFGIVIWLGVLIADYVNPGWAD